HRWLGGPAVRRQHRRLGRRAHDRRRPTGRHLRTGGARCRAPLALPARDARRAGRQPARAGAPALCHAAMSAQVMNTAARVLVVDDDVRYCEWLRHHLDVLLPRSSVSMLNSSEFERWCTQFSGRDCELLLLSAVFGSSPDDPQSPGLSLLRRLREQPAMPAVIALAEDGNELTAVRALHPPPPPPPAPPPPPPAAPAAPAAGAAPESEPLQGAGVVGLLAGANAEVIPGYTLRLKIGESAKAVVYLATSAHRGHNVALKVSKTLRDEAAGRQFLEREYTAVMAVRSRLVAEIYDYGVHAGFEYLAMEYLPRGDLKARIQRGVSEREALHLVTQIAAALEVVHEAGLVHRDLKPPNVMLRENGAVALIDFGLARTLDGNSVSTQTGVLLGS